MKKTTATKRPPLRKIALYTVGTGLSLIGLSLAASSYLFLHLNNYQATLKNFLKSKTAWEFDFSAIHSQFNANWQPVLQIDNLTLTAAGEKQAMLQLKQLQLVLSYRSFLKLRPILSLLAIDGGHLNLRLSSTDDLFLNNHLLTNLSTAAKESIDWQTPLLWQQQIRLTNLNISYTDNKHALLPLSLNKLNLTLTNLKHQQHNLDAGFELNNNSLKFSNYWQGKSLYQIANWQTASAQLNSLDRLGYLLNFKAQITKGKFSSIIATFDSNQQPINFSKDSKQNLSSLKLALAIKSSGSNNYQINAKDITINSQYGYLLKNTAIQGNYQPKQGGWLNFSGIDFNNLSNLLHFSQNLGKLNFSGRINQFKVSWLGKILQPQSFRLQGEFKNVELKSNDANIPSLNNINGMLDSSQSNGTLKLTLNQSQLRLPAKLNKTILIQHFATTSNWQLESANKVKLTWSDTSLQSKDFLIKSSGSYDQMRESINIQAHLTSFNLSSILNYLPRTTPTSVVSGLKQSQLSGYLQNGDLSLVGNPRKIPFNNGGGSLSFKADLTNTQFKFDQAFGGISGLNAKLSINNQQLNLKINSAKLAHNNINATSVNIPDITKANGILNAQGEIKGQSNNYLDYLQASPFAEQANKITQKLSIHGLSQIKFKLKLPLQNPKKSKVDGSYWLENNKVTAKDSNLNVDKINGTINFNEKGLKKSKLTANSFDSKLNLNILNNAQLEVNSPNLSYANLIELLAPQANQVIYGRAATQLNYNIPHRELLIQSNLEGVTLAMPTPLAKAETESKDVTLHLYSSGESGAKQADFNYANTLFASARLNQELQLNKLQVALGTADYQPVHSSNESAVISVNAKLEDARIVEWAKAFQKLMPTQNGSKKLPLVALATPNYILESAENSALATKSGLYPIQVEINTNGFWLNNYNFDRGYANITIESDMAKLAIQTPDISGKIEYLNESQQVNIHLNRLLFSSSNLQSSTKATNSIQSASIEQQNTQAMLNNQLNIESSNNPAAGTKDITFSPESLNLLKIMETESIVDYSQPRMSSSINIPKISLLIDNFYYQNHYLGKFSSYIYQEQNVIYLENGTLSNKAAVTKFSLSDQCFGCGESHEEVSLLLRSDIHNFGRLLNKLDMGDSFNKGNGGLELAMRYHGGLANFNYKKTTTNASLSIKQVELTHVKPGIFGTLLGVVTMKSAFTGVDTLTSFATTGKINMHSLFGNTLVFDSLNTAVSVNQGDVTINNLVMDGGMVKIQTFGNIYLESNTLNTYLTVEPKIGTTLATTIGIITLNPVIGFMVYFGDILLGNPQNKALALSFHIQGNFESPTMTKTNLSKQFIENVGSSINVFK